MLPLNHVINSPTLSPQHIVATSSIYRQLTSDKQKQQQKRQKRPTTTTNTTITTATLFSVHITNITSSLFSSISSTQQQQLSFEDPYSAKTGIKTAALLGGMLFLVIFYLIWKARGRLCRSSSDEVGNSRLSAAKFDLAYWLKQVDLLEAKELERHRGGQSLYLELPNIEPRNNREATALWIADTYRHWRLIRYRQQQQIFRKNTNQQPEINFIPYRRRRYRIHRFLRRFFKSNRQHPLILFEHPQSLINDMRLSIVSNNFIPSSFTPNLPIRRTCSWPVLKSNHHQSGVPMSALQTHLARKRLLKRTSRTTFDI
ncbi:unnamed protein product [Rotaria sordida]|uniref:Uncharacterized protein n=1 Tax=Rotaria sordida TaxID=392033 RepID=A0A814EDB9_9BILA|nr:unnamed protein product [Rotaria sordida]